MNEHQSGHRLRRLKLDSENKIRAEKIQNSPQKQISDSEWTSLERSESQVFFHFRTISKTQK